MKKFKGMLLACDMDGTLLDDSKQIPAENLRALQYFTKKGGRLSPLLYYSSGLSRRYSVNAPQV